MPKATHRAQGLFRDLRLYGRQATEGIVPLTAMPYCVRCQAWFPKSAPECGLCGGTLTGDRPVIVATGAGEGGEGSLSRPAHRALLPDVDAERLDTREARQLVALFEPVRQRARGRHSAPESWLPASGSRVATALDVVAAETEFSDWKTTRHLREALVDLQAFLPDDDAAAAEACATRQSNAAVDDMRGRAALDQVRWAQAIAISGLRDDERVLGAHNALRDIDIVVGESQRSLAAVDRYKESQALGFAAIPMWPTGLIVGLVMGSVLAGPTIAAIAVVILLAIGGTVVGLSPAFGAAVGTLGSRVDRLAMRTNHIAFVAVGRTIATGLEIALLVGGPVVIGICLAFAVDDAAAGTVTDSPLRSVARAVLGGIILVAASLIVWRRHRAGTSA